MKMIPSASGNGAAWRCFSAFALMLAVMLGGSSALAQEGHASRLVVFVHGIFGTIDSTFRAPGQQLGWPEITDADPLFDDADIRTFQFESTLNPSSSRIIDIAKLMKTELEAEDIDILGYNDVVFVAHSLGGIVVRQYLVNESKLEGRGVLAGGRIKGLYLLGTPMNGAGIANLGSEFFNSPTLFELNESHDPNAFLNRLRADWIDAKLGTEIPSDCIHETKGEVTFEVLGFELWSAEPADRESVEALCNIGLSGFPENHGGLVKPTGQGDYRHNRFQQFFLGLFPDADDAMGDDEIVLARCEASKFGDGVTYQLAQELDLKGLKYHYSRYLPKDWPAGGPLGMVFRQTAPKVVVLHFSCFQQGPETETGIAEGARDFNRFLADLATNEGIKLVIYSRADPADITSMMTMANRQALIDTRRLEFVPLRYKVPATQDQIDFAMSKIEGFLKSGASGQ